MGRSGGSSSSKSSSSKSTTVTRPYTPGALKPSPITSEGKQRQMERAAADYSAASGREYVYSAERGGLVETTPVAERPGQELLKGVTITPIDFGKGPELPKAVPAPMVRVAERMGPPVPTQAVTAGAPTGKTSGFQADVRQALRGAEDYLKQEALTVAQFGLSRVYPQTRTAAAMNLFTSATQREQGFLAERKKSEAELATIKRQEEAQQRVETKKTGKASYRAGQLEDIQKQLDRMGYGAYQERVTSYNEKLSSLVDQGVITQTPEGTSIINSKVPLATAESLIAQGVQLQQEGQKFLPLTQKMGRIYPSYQSAYKELEQVTHAGESLDFSRSLTENQITALGGSLAKAEFFVPFETVSNFLTAKGHPGAAAEVSRFGEGVSVLETAAARISGTKRVGQFLFPEPTPKQKQEIAALPSTLKITIPIGYTEGKFLYSPSLEFTNPILGAFKTTTRVNEFVREDYFNRPLGATTEILAIAGGVKAVGYVMGYGGKVTEKVLPNLISFQPLGKIGATGIKFAGDVTKLGVIGYLGAKGVQQYQLIQAQPVGEARAEAYGQTFGTIIGEMPRYVVAGIAYKSGVASGELAFEKSLKGGELVYVDIASTVEERGVRLPEGLSKKGKIDEINIQIQEKDFYSARTYQLFGKDIAIVQPPKEIVTTEGYRILQSVTPITSEQINLFKELQTKGSQLQLFSPGKYSPKEITLIGRGEMGHVIYDKVSSDQTFYMYGEEFQKQGFKMTGALTTRGTPKVSPEFYQEPLLLDKINAKNLQVFVDSKTFFTGATRETYYLYPKTTASIFDVSLSAAGGWTIKPNFYKGEFLFEEKLISREVISGSSKPIAYSIGFGTKKQTLFYTPFDIPKAMEGITRGEMPYGRYDLVTYKGKAPKTVTFPESVQINFGGGSFYGTKFSRLLNQPVVYQTQVISPERITPISPQRPSDITRSSIFLPESASYGRFGPFPEPPYFYIGEPPAPEPTGWRWDEKTNTITFVGNPSRATTPSIASKFDFQKLAIEELSQKQIRGRTIAGFQRLFTEQEESILTPRVSFAFPRQKVSQAFITEEAITPLARYGFTPLSTASFASATVVTTLFGQSLLPRQLQLARTTQITRQQEITRQREILRSLQVPRVKELTRQQEITRVLNLPRTAELTRTQEITRQQELFRELTLEIPRFGGPGMGRLSFPRFPNTPSIPSIFQPEFLRRRRKLKSKYKVYKRRYGKDYLIGERESIGTATDFLKGQLKISLAASGFITTEGGQKVRFGELGSYMGQSKEFRTSKYDPFRLVQARRFRLGTGAEKGEIQLARKSKGRKTNANKLSIPRIF